MPKPKPNQRISEGTLALITAIHLKLSPLVGGKALACIHFASPDAALRVLTQGGLAACELLDAYLLRNILPKTSTAHGQQATPQQYW